MVAILRHARPEPVLFLLWAAELVQLIWSSPALRSAGGYLMIAYVALALPRLRRGTILLCLPLAGAAVALAALLDQWGKVLQGFENAAVFMAFFGSIVLLRAIADHRPEIARARNLFTGLRPAETNSAFLVGAHLIGSVLVVGVMAILAPILKDDADEPTRRRAAEVSQRGMCLAPLWSPFWVAAAFTAQQIPGVPAWEIMSLGLGLAAVGMVTAHLMFARNVGLANLWQAVLGFGPIVPSVAVCALMIAGLSTVAGLSTLEALIATIPVLALLSVAADRRTDATRLVLETWRGSGRVADEIAVVTTALILGRVLEYAVHEVGLADTVGALDLAPWAVIACVVGIVTVGALVGIHQLVSIIVVLVVFVPLETGIDDTVMMEAALVGWAFASMIGVTAVSTATASAMFRVSRTRLIYGPNLYFVAVFGVIAIALLSLANGLFFMR